MELQKRCEEAAEQSGRFVKIDIGNRIKFNKVSFSYDGSSPVIKDFDIAIMLDRPQPLSVHLVQAKPLLLIS